MEMQFEASTLRSFKSYLNARLDSANEAYGEVIDTLLSARPPMPDRMDLDALNQFMDRIALFGKGRAFARTLFREYRQVRKHQGW